MRLLTGLIVVALLSAVSTRADAQPREDWEVSVVPLYFWLTSLDGDLSAGPATVPVSLNFSDLADKISGAFAVHFEASRGRWGILTDLDFTRLSSSSAFSVADRRIEGEFELDSVIFEVGGSYLLNPNARFGVIGGLRTYTVSSKLQFRGTDTAATPIDSTMTSPNGFVGFIVRPRISDRWTFLGRADIGAGDANFTWSGFAGLDFRVSSWGAVEFGYKALGIDIKNDDRTVREYGVTHYGPIFGFRFHWGQ